MGKSAKFYKRPTKKEKLGLVTKQERLSLQKNVQRHAAISTQFNGSASGGNSKGAVATSSSEPGVSHAETLAAAPAAARSAVEQRAQKLLLEAEKRALAKEQELERNPDAMDENGPVAAVTTKKKAGASGMKAKANKRKGDTNSDAATKKTDYVDLFDGRRRS